jgi:hypothetical protein
MQAPLGGYGPDHVIGIGSLNVVPLIKDGKRAHSLSGMASVIW